MPVRLRKYNIGVMPQPLGLSLKLTVFIGIAAVVSVLGLILLVLFTGAGWLSLLLLALPVGLYIVFRAGMKKEKSRIAAVKTGVWLHELEVEVLRQKLEKGVEHVKETE